MTNCLKQHIFQKLSLFPASGTKSIPGGPLRLHYPELLGTIETVNLIRYAPRSRSSPSAVTGNRLLKN